MLSTSNGRDEYSSSADERFDVLRFDEKLRIREWKPKQTLSALLPDDAKAGDLLPPLLPTQLHPLLLPRLHETLDGASLSIDLPPLPHGDTHIHLRMQLFPERDGHGNIVGATSCITDITRQVREQREILSLWHALDSHAIVAITDARGTIVEVNDHFCEISRYSRQELIGQNHRILNSGLHPPEFFCEMWRTISRGKVWNGEIRNRAKNGAFYWVKTSIYPVLDAQGRPRRYIALRTDITENKRIAEELHYQSTHDPLTGLPNRWSLKAGLQQKLDNQDGQRHSLSAVVFIDVDKFKDINDTHGHLTGDQVLCVVADRLLAAVGNDGQAYRIGGDEFVILLSGLPADSEAALTQARRISDEAIRELGKPLRPGMPDIVIGACAGIRLLDDACMSLEDALRHADIALSQAKLQGKRQVRVFDRQMEQALLSRTQLENRLRRALHDDELLMHYQPIVDVDGKTVSLEALLRWRSEGELLAPGSFIDVAEQSGLIVPIGDRVLEMASRQTAELHQRLAAPPLVAINVSASQFCLSRFVPKLIETLHQTGARPEWIWLELTESMLLKDKTMVADKMRALKALGVRFALDDFGTGYSSLSYLKDFPFDRIKIDQSFVRTLLEDVASEMIVRAILSISAAMDMDVIAEGVETPEQRDRLFAMGCRRFQGYLFSRPKDLAELYP